MKSVALLCAVLKKCALLSFFCIAMPVQAQITDLNLGVSGWTGFSPLMLAQQSGLFKKHGLDVKIIKIPQASRHLAMAAGDIQCSVTSLETWVSWHASGLETTQILAIDKSYGADGIVVRENIHSFEDLKGKTVAAASPGTSPYFLLAWMLRENNMTMQDVRVVNMEAGPAAQAFIAGQNDAAMSYEPFLSAVRGAPNAGKILATTLDYPAVIDTLGCSSEFIKNHPHAAKALVEGYFEALQMISADRDKAFEIMGADANQTREQFATSAQYLKWYDRLENKKFFEEEWGVFTEKAADLLLDLGIIRSKPDISRLADPSFIN